MYINLGICFLVNNFYKNRTSHIETNLTILASSKPDEIDHQDIQSGWSNLGGDELTVNPQLSLPANMKQGRLHT